MMITIDANIGWLMALAWLSMSVCFTAGEGAIKYLHTHVSVPKDTIMEALKVLIDVRNHPVLIRCKWENYGRGCPVGCLRKLQSWCSSSVLEEYQRFADAKSRITDLRFMDTFDFLSLRQCLYSIICHHQGYGLKKRRLLYREENLQKPQLTSV